MGNHLWPGKARPMLAAGQRAPRMASPWDKAQWRGQRRLISPLALRMKSGHLPRASVVRWKLAAMIVIQLVIIFSAGCSWGNSLTPLVSGPSPE